MVEKSKIIAFVPARGGSKSIPLKNIKLFCGKPLIYWSLLSLSNTTEIDEIYVATDSDNIKKVVEQYNFKKVKIYDRDPINAQDTSSTESVMLEFIEKMRLSNDTVFILSQLTCPLTQTIHYDEAINQFLTTEVDSILSCAKLLRFFWDDSGTPINYDYQNRPRRQNFKGTFMENGAFYINTVGEIVKTKNRLSGSIGIYEMPEFTAIDIDEPEDWDFAESVMKKNILKNNDSNIKLFLTDVDGVLTDAGMYYSEDGNELKKFITRDGMGFELLRRRGIKTGIITSENTKIVEKRANKIKADYLYQGVKNKVEIANEICKKENLALDNIAYIGDDINDTELLKIVGIAATPADGCDENKKLPGIIVLKKKGGEGVVREFIERILAK